MDLDFWTFVGPIIMMGAVNPHWKTKNGYGSRFQPLILSSLWCIRRRVTISFWNSLSPWLLPGFKHLTATSLPCNVHLCTVPKPPCPRRLASEKSSVAADYSSKVYVVVLVGRGNGGVPPSECRGCDGSIAVKMLLASKF